MSWFGCRNVSTDHRIVILAFIRHFQFVIASQQLTMELYNEAIEDASSTFGPGDELLVRGGGLISDPSHATKYVLPALREKLAILNELIASHAALAQRANSFPKVERAHRQMSEFLNVARARGQRQEECWLAWVDDPLMDLGARMSGLDGTEMQAMGASIASVNALLPAAGVDKVEFAEINRQAFNIVRAQRALSPLTQRAFEALFLIGMSGERPRFFTE